MNNPNYFELHRSIKFAVLRTLSSVGRSTLTISDIDFFNSLSMSDIIQSKDIEHAIKSLHIDGCIEITVSDNNIKSRWSSFQRGVNANDEEWDDFHIDQIMKLRINEYGLESYKILMKSDADYIQSMRSQDADGLVSIVEELYENYSILEHVKYEEDIFGREINLNPKYQIKSVELIEELLNCIKSNNQAMAFKDANLSSSIAEIENGLDEVKKGRTTVEKLEYCFYGSLAYIATAFADAPIGDLAERTWNAVKLLIETSIT